MTRFSDAKYRRWFIQGTVGVLLTGAGLCGLIECGFLKHGGADTWTWVGLGTVCLIVFMSGFIMSIDSLRFRELDK